MGFAFASLCIHTFARAPDTSRRSLPVAPAAGTTTGFMELPMGDTGNGCYPPLYFDKTFNLSSSAMPAQEYGFPPEPETCAESCRSVEGCKYFVHDGSDNRCWLNRVPTSGKFGCGMKDYKAYVLTGVARKPCGPVNMVRAWSACLMCDRFVPHDGAHCRCGAACAGHGRLAAAWRFHQHVGHKHMHAHLATGRTCLRRPLGCCMKPGAHRLVATCVFARMAEVPGRGDHGNANNPGDERGRTGRLCEEPGECFLSP